MEPMVRIELTTYGLRNRCSTTELHWRRDGRAGHWKAGVLSGPASYCMAKRRSQEFFCRGVSTKQTRVFSS